MWFKRKPKEEKIWFKDGVVIYSGTALKIARKNGKRLMGNLYLNLYKQEFKDIVNGC